MCADSKEGGNREVIQLESNKLLNPAAPELTDSLQKALVQSVAGSQAQK